MNTVAQTRERHALVDEGGQVLLLFAISLSLLIGMLGFVVDFGRVLYARSVLQASSDAAATAAAQEINVSGRNPTATATAYSSLAGQRNARPNVPGVSMAVGYPLLKCVTSIGLPCHPPSNSNAIAVRQQVTVPMIFARVLGMNSMVVSATATAGMKQGGFPPYDIVVLLDTSDAMSATPCSASVPGRSNPSALDCAKAGIRALLQRLWPCSSTLTRCGAVNSTGNVVNPVDKVGLVIFPPLIHRGDVAKELDCASNIAPTQVAYDDPVNKGIDPGYTYAIVHPSSDYRTSDASATLNNNSKLVKAVHWTTCSSAGTYGVEAPGGVGSSFAVALEKAQSELDAYGRPGVRDVIIVVSDGAANYGPVYKDTQPASPETSPHRTRPCAQTIAVANGLSARGTWIYSVHYGSSGPCLGWTTFDTFHVSSAGGTSPATFSRNESPALGGGTTMRGVASDPAKYFDQPGPADLTGIFKEIGDTLTTTRLLDNNTP